MKQSLTKLVDAALQKLDESTGKPLSEKGLRTWLKGEGYPKRDIEEAIKLLEPRIRPLHPIQPPGPITVRTLSDYEAMKLMPAAQQALARLEQYQLIDCYERELILDRLNHFDGEVGLEELDYLVSWVVCGNRDVESQQAIYNVLDGVRSSLH